MESTDGNLVLIPESNSHINRSEPKRGKTPCSKSKPVNNAENLRDMLNPPAPPNLFNAQDPTLELL